MIEFRGERRRAAGDERRRVARRSPRARRCTTAGEKAKRTGRRRGLGLRAGQDARGLLPGARRHPLRDREVAGRGAVRRPALDGDQDRRPRRRASEFADAIHAEFPDKMLAYNLSPSFNWDTTGMSDEEMRRSPRSSARWASSSTSSPTAATRSTALAAEEFATALQQDGMLALARLQRKFRLVESPYRTPADARRRPARRRRAAGLSGRTATTKAMGKGSTQHQHLVQTEVPTKLLEEWLALWTRALRARREAARRAAPAHAPARSCSSSGIYGDGDEKAGQRHLRPDPGPPRPQHPLGARPEHLRRAPAQEAADDADAPVPDPPLQGRARSTTSRPPRTTSYQTEKMKRHGIFSDVYQEVGEIIVADVNKAAHRGAARTRPRGAAPTDQQAGLNGLLYPPELRSTREKPREVRVECNSGGVFASGRWAEEGGGPVQQFAPAPNRGGVGDREPREATGIGCGGHGRRR